MPQFFKRVEEKKPFTYPAITEVRKGSNNYTGWIIGIALLTVLIGITIYIFQ